MEYMKCKHCGNCSRWKDAFSKFGFNDGDGLIKTPVIAQALENAGYAVKFSRWSPHNTIIYSIKRDGIQYMPNKNSNYLIGYDDPQEYLPVDILALLNTEFPPVSLFSK